MTAVQSATTVGSALNPGRHLWPWIASVVVFHFVLNSGQGAALAATFTASNLSFWLVAAALTTSWLLFASGALLALIAASGNSVFSDVYRPTFRARGVAIGAIWVLTVSLTPLLELSLAVNDFALRAACITLALCGILGAGILGIHARKPESPSKRLLLIIYEHRLWLSIVACLMGVLPLLAGALVSIYFPYSLSSLGPLPLTLLGLGANSLLIGVLFVVLPLCLGLSWLRWALTALMLCWFLFQPFDVDYENPLLADDALIAETSLNPQSCIPTPGSVGASINSRVASVKSNALKPIGDFGDHRLYLISAEGGGIRAAYWTALNLAQADVGSDGRFGDEVGTVSGVSGGSLGIATWLASRGRTDLSTSQRFDLVKSFLSSDFLSPVIGGLLFLDTPRALLGPFWFSARRDHVFEKSIASRWAELGKTDFFVRPFLRLCLEGFKHPPFVSFGATDALSGSEFALNKWGAQAGSQDFTLQTSSIRNATVAQMVHISARFPFVAPPAQVGIDPATIASDVEIGRQRSLWRANKQNPSSAERESVFKSIREKAAALSSAYRWPRQLLLVDGGYVDNTGLAPTLQAVELLKERKARERERANRSNRPAMIEASYSSTSVNMLHMSNDPLDGCMPVPPQPLERLTTRARALATATSMQLECYRDLEKLELWFSASHFDALTAPFQTLMAVRSSASRRSLVYLENATDIEDDIDARILSVGAALSHALRPNDPMPMPVTPDSVREGHYTFLKLQEALLNSLVKEGLGQQVAHEYLNTTLRPWKERMERAYSDATCVPNTPVPTLPLGWLLDSASEALLKCLVAKEAFFLGYAVPPPPAPPSMQIGEVTVTPLPPKQR